jgi:hypothetical protein
MRPRPCGYASIDQSARGAPALQATPRNRDAGRFRRRLPEKHYCETLARLPITLRNGLNVAVVATLARLEPPQPNRSTAAEIGHTAPSNELAVAAPALD